MQQSFFSHPTSVPSSHFASVKQDRRTVGLSVRDNRRSTIAVGVRSSIRSNSRRNVWLLRRKGRGQSQKRSSNQHSHRFNKYRFAVGSKSTTTAAAVELEAQLCGFLLAIVGVEERDAPDAQS